MEKPRRIDGAGGPLAPPSVAPLTTSLGPSLGMSSGAASAAGSAGQAAAALLAMEATHRQLTERILLSALREQDAAALAEAGRERAQFLAEAGLRFGASLDQELTYEAVASVTLPSSNAWSIVDIVETGGTLRRLAVIHPDDSKQSVARALGRQWTASEDDTIGVPAIRKGRIPIIVTEHAESRVIGEHDASTAAIVRWLGVGSLLVVPILAHNVLLGAITYVAAPGNERFTPDDVRLAEQLAARCAQALESARLYAAARAAWAAAETARADADAARAVAESSNSTKARFLATMSHELRTPLNAIGGYAQLLELGVRGPVTAEQQHDLVNIQRSQAHLVGLVDAVLNYAQLEAGRVVYNISDVDLSEAVASVEGLVAPLLLEKNITYTITPCDRAVTVRADAAKVRQIIVNLVGNATKFTPIGGRITVVCSPGASDANADDESSGMPTVRVSDTGIGIPEDKLESVFEPFVQVNRRLTSADVGVGLGLAISRELAEGMGGRLTVVSSPDGGTTFTLSLPAA